MSAQRRAPPDPAAEARSGASAPGTAAATARTAELGLLATVVFWAVNFSVAKYALASVGPMAFNALRFPLASALLWAVLRRRGPLVRPRGRDLANLVGLGLLGNVVYQVLFILGLDRTLAGNASLLLAATPVWAAILARAVGGERHPATVWLGIGSTLLGIVLVVFGSGGAVAAGTATLPGDLMLVAGSVAWAVFTVVSGGLIARYGALVVTAWTLWIGTACLVVLGIPGLLAQDWSAFGAGEAGAVVFAGVASIALAYLFWYNGVKVIGATRTAAYSNLVPVLALAVAWAWLGEVPTTLQLLGAGVIIAGVSLTRRGGRRVPAAN